MSEIFSIKMETFAYAYKQEDSNSDINTLSYNTTKFENFTNMVNDINEDKAEMDEMEEFLPEKVKESTIDIIKEEDVNEMDECLPEDSPTSASSHTWKSDDRMESIIQDMALHQHVTQQHLTNTTTHQISLPKLEIIDVHTDENDGKGLEINGDTDTNVTDNKDRCITSSSRAAQTPAEHKCEICGRSYREESNLRRHMRKNHPLSIDTEYICKICNQRYTTQLGLDFHCYRMHPEARTPNKHKCEICGSCYRRSNAFLEHMRIKHPLSIDTEHMCNICNQRFTTQPGLDRHSYVTHPPLAEHKCEICGLCYKLSSSLSEHIRMKHPSSIDADYICEICHKRFATQKGLDKHYHIAHPGASSTQTSAKYNCEICGRCYTDDVRTLRKHMRIKHPLSIDTEHICEICNLRFTTKVGLYRHCISKH
ncbi:uncharacterized protein [Musca autumnalis]|uniref:uncharacterized protein n=1 Tax=Musca autumnalis TaxID=221902 RepID=UPI003CF7A82D